MLNRIILIGRLTRDPEAKVTPSGVSVTTFSIAVDRPQSAEARQSGQEKQTDFIDIVAWRQTAEFAANYLQKGRLVAVEGKLQIREYVTQEGQKRKAAEVVADNVRPLDKPRDGSEGGDNQDAGGYGNNGGGGGGGYERQGGGRSNGGGDSDYNQAPAAAAAVAAPPRSSGGGGGNYGGNSGGGAGRPAPAAGGARRAPAAQPATNFDDNDDLSDPFAE
jgi:single-strand DNA-binding protein